MLSPVVVEDFPVTADALPPCTLCGHPVSFSGATVHVACLVAADRPAPQSPVRDIGPATSVESEQASALVADLAARRRNGRRGRASLS